MLKSFLSPEKLLSVGICEQYHKKSLKDYIGWSGGIDAYNSYIKNIQYFYENGVGLFMTGKNGCGKTMLGIEILKMYMREDIDVQFTTLQGIMNLFTLGWKSDEEKIKFEIAIREVSVLMIDEMDEFFTFNSSTVSTLMTQTIRYRTSRLKPTLMTSNTKPKKISAVCEKLYSLLQGFMIPINFPDEALNYRKIMSEKHLKIFTGGF